MHVDKLEYRPTILAPNLCAAKTIHFSQGDTEQKIVVNFNTRIRIPDIHYVGLSRLTTIEDLYITDLCEDKIAVNPQAAAEMELLRKERRLIQFTRGTKCHSNYVNLALQLVTFVTQAQ